MLPDDQTEIEDTVRAIVRDVLGLSADRAGALRAETPLFGAMPELDSLAVAGLFTELEDRLGISIDDDEVSADTVASFGALTRFAAAKANA